MNKRILKAAIISTLFSSAYCQAAAPNEFTDTAAVFQMMRDARERIVNYRAAVQNLAAAKENLVAAQNNLELAKTERQNAIEGLAEAKNNLAAAKSNLLAVQNELARAESESSARTAAAIAAQQAVADFLPQIYEQQAEVDDLAAQLENLKAARPAINNIESAAKNDNRAALIESEWEKAGFDPGRLEEIRARVNSEEGMTTENTADNSAAEAAYENELDSLESNLDAATARLDELNDELAALYEAQNDAETAESEARQEVAELTNEQSTATKEVEENEQALAAAVSEKKISLDELKKAQFDLNEETAAKQKAEQELNHFGEGISFSSDFEFYHFNGKNSYGSQLYKSYNTDYEFHNGAVTLSTGRVKSYIHTNAENNTGSINHVTDTQLSAVYRNNKKINDTHYLLEFNLPTGKSDANALAALPDMLARYTSFGEGFNITPGIEGVHHFNELDSFTGRLTYSFRGSYNSSLLVTGNNAVEQTKVNPGNLLNLHLSYLHAGEKEKLYSYIDYEKSGSITQRELGTENISTVTDGAGIGIGAYYIKDITAKNSWQTYILWYRDGKANGNNSPLNRGINYYGGGIGMRHELASDKHLSLMLQYLKGNGSLDSWRTGIGTASPRKISYLLSYDWRINEHNSLKAALERYLLADKSAGDYNGWNFGLYLSRAF